MSTGALTGSDSVTINNRIFSDFADGDFAALTFPGEFMKTKVGKNGNSVYVFDNSGELCEFVIRLIKGSGDDKYMQSQITNLKANPASYVLMQGELTQKVGDGQGTVTKISYVLGGGVPYKNVDAKANAEGDTNQAIVEYRMRFSNAPRTLS